MPDRSYSYVIIGAGLAGASAVEGIRERDKNGSILLIGAEPDLPYDRPPLSKNLWFGTQKLEEIFRHDAAFYRDNGVDLALGSEIVELDARARMVRDSGGNGYAWQRLLLATGGQPRRLSIPGGDLPGICYYRTIEDYRRSREQAAPGRSAVVIGGGFIGSEMAAALQFSKLNVTMIFPEDYLAARVFPESLGRAIQDQYRAHGIEVFSGDVPVSIERNGARFITRTRSGRRIESDLVIAGIGIAPRVELGKMADLEVGNGIVVNEFLQTSDPNIYAAGDNAFFPEAVLGPTRVEHWDNAINQGKCAGRNMAGAREPYDYLPFFFSDLFEFGYEAVGEVNSRLETFADWQEENKTGVVYYLRDSQVRGVMMCNVWNQVDTARALIRAQRQVTVEELRRAIPLPETEAT